MMEILSIVSVITSCIVAVVHAVIAYKNSKEPPKDEIWETALQITLRETGGLGTPDDFAMNYELLKAFKNNGCSLSGENTIGAMFRKKAQAQGISHRQDS